MFLLVLFNRILYRSLSVVWIDILELCESCDQLCMQMDHSHSARHRNSKHEDTVFYYTDVDITPRPPPPSYEKNTAPRISSDILEVTNNKGAVGFVAVGRVRNYQGPNPSPHYHTAPNLPRSADQHNRHADTNYEGQVSRNHQRPIHADHYADYYHSPMHSRHHSEPTLIEDRDNIPFNRSTPNRLNSRDEIYETPTSRNASITTVASEPTNRRVKKSKRNRHSKSCSQSESERKEPGKIISLFCCIRPNACNEFSGIPPAVTQFSRNVAAMASRWQHCVQFNQHNIRISTFHFRGE